MQQTELEKTQNYGIQFHINDKVVDAARDNYLTLDEIFYLYETVTNNVVLDHVPATINKLVRLGFLKDSSTLTPFGEEFILDLMDEEIVAPDTFDENSFNELWLLFPKDDKYRHFPLTRPIRYNKGETRKAYKEALKEVSHAQLVECLNKEIYYRRQSETENLFKYMKGSVNWLKEKAYEMYLNEDHTFYKDDEQFGKDLG